MVFHRFFLGFSMVKQPEANTTGLRYQGFTEAAARLHLRAAWSSESAGRRKNEKNPSEKTWRAAGKSQNYSGLMGFYSDLMGFYSDLMGFYSDLMGFYSDSMGY